MKFKSFLFTGILLLTFISCKDTSKKTAPVPEISIPSNIDTLFPGFPKILLADDALEPFTTSNSNLMPIEERIVRKLRKEYLKESSPTVETMEYYNHISFSTYLNLNEIKEIISIMETDPTLDKSKLGIFIYPIKYDLDEAKILSSKLRENNYGKFAAFVINGTSTQDSIDQVAKALFEKKRSVVIQMAHGRKPLLGYESGGKTLETAFNFGRLCPPECDDDEDYITAAITNNYGELWDKIKIK